MSKCDPTDPHSWQLAYVIQGTRPFPECLFVCACGLMRRVQHYERLTPDQRIEHMRARAEAAAQEEENDE